MPSTPYGLDCCRYHHLALLVEILLIECWVPRGVADEAHRHGKIRRRRGHEIFALLLTRGAVVGDSELIDVLHVIGAFFHGAIRFEEHVLVEMRKAVQLRRLREGAVADGELHRDQRDGMILEGDDLQSVGQHSRRQPGGLGERSG